MPPKAADTIASIALLAALLLAGCESHAYSGRCGDPPHGTAWTVLGCSLMHDDAASGGRWRWHCS